MLSYFNAHSWTKKILFFYHRIVIDIPLSESVLKEAYLNLIVRDRENVITEEGMSQKNDFYKESKGPDLWDPASSSF